MKITKPKRVSHTYTQKIKANPLIVFPLLGPNREIDWVNGWLPDEIISNSGLAELDCIFTTTNDEGKAFWIITKYEPEEFRMEIVKIVPESFVTNVRLKINEIKNGSDLIVTYQITSLGKKGDKKVKGFTEKQARTLVDWHLRAKKSD
ncbi:MAG: hypothetical protein IIB83_08500 [Bacteroidetes bacterium]|nr:hypothetical protein [Bacteroidota bacterium]